MFEIFEKYELLESQLEKFGFQKDGTSYHYQQLLDQENFEIRVKIEDGKLSFKVFDIDFDEEYLLLHQETNQGEFIGQMRQACLDVLLSIREACYRVTDFSFEQSQRLVDYVAQTYSGKLEYLWEDSSNKTSAQTGVFRHQADQKWYGVVMQIDWKKLDQGKDGKIEVLNVKNDQVSQELEKKGIYPAFHMNKKYWLSLPLDDSLSDKELVALLDRSFELTQKKGKKS